MSRVEEVEAKLQQAFPGHDRLEINVTKGIRMFYITGDLLSMCDFDSEMLDALKAALPEDAAIVIFNGKILNFFFSSQAGDFRDRFALALASNAWSRVPAGGAIPGLEVRFTREGNTRDGKLTCTIKEDTWNPYADALQHLSLKDFDIVIAKTPEAWEGLKNYSESSHPEGTGEQFPIVECTFIPGGVTVEHKSVTLALKTLVNCILDPKASSASVHNLAKIIQDEFFKE